MDLSDLLREERIKRVGPDPKQAEHCLHISERDIKIAKGTLELDCDGSFVHSYNSLLQAVRGLMFAEGYKPVGESNHKTVVDYADVKFGAKLHNLVELFDSMRRKRHIAMYERAGTISRFEAEQAIKTAQEFVAKVKEKMKKG